MKARQLVETVIVAVLFLQASEALRADGFTVAYDTVQASSFLALSNGFNGSRVTVAQVELNAPETNHIAFANVHYTFHQNDPVGAHPTAVGSILLGSGTGFNGGVATGVTNAEYWNANNFINEVVVSNVTINSKVVSQSYTAGTNNYVAGNAAFDYFIQQQKVVVVSGGVGTASNWDWPSSCYNGIAVGASDAYGNPSGSPVGPTQDRRSKPDLIAPRSTQVAASPSLVGNNFTFTNSSYTNIEGVSLSTPFVSGAAAILVDKAMGTSALSNGTDPRVVKSILMTSAKKMAGWSNSASAPLDPIQGAGLLQVKNAFDLLSSGQQAAGSITNKGWDFASVGGVLASARTNTYNLSITNGEFANNTFELSATLTWFLPVTMIAPGSYSLPPMPNLDLLLNSGGATLQMSTSRVDNVQLVWFTTNAAGTYSLAVATPSTSAVSYAVSWQAVAVPEPSILVLLLVIGAPLLLASRKAAPR